MLAVAASVPGGAALSLTRERPPTEPVHSRLTGFEQHIADLAAVLGELPAERIPEQIEHSLQDVAEHLVVDRVDVLQWSKNRRRLQATYAWSAEGNTTEPFDLGVAASARMRAHLDRRFVVHTVHPEELPEIFGNDSPVYLRHGVRSLAMVPLRARGVSLGALVLSTCRSERDWPDVLIALLQILGQIYAEALVRHCSEREMQRSRAVADVALASLSPPVAVLDRQGTVLLANGAWQQALQGNRAPPLVAGLPGTSYLRVCRRAAANDPDQFRSLPKDLQSVLNGHRGQLVVEYAIRTASTEHWFELLAEPLPEGAGGAILTHRDITISKHAETQARRRYQEEERAGQMLALGEMAAALAHELKQPLAAILTNAQAAQRFLAEDAPDLIEIEEILADICKADQRAVGILSRVRAMIGGSTSDFVRLSLGDLIQNLAASTGAELRRCQVRLGLELDPATPCVRGDVVLLQQALLNLMRNAVEAMETTPVEVRRLTIRTRTVDAKVEVSVEDRGCGITEERLTQVLRPFYTTKQSGMGIGLTVTGSIVELHGGRLWATNNAEGGATLHFTLPILKEGMG